MTAPRKPGFVLPVAVTLAALLALYVGAYCWSVTPMDTYVESTGFVVEAYYGGRFADDPREAAWERETAWDHRLKPLFAPIHWFDRRMRPHVWELTP